MKNDFIVWFKKIYSQEVNWFNSQVNRLYEAFQDGYRSGRASKTWIVPRNNEIISIDYIVGCISSYTCPKCNKKYLCDSSGKAGTVEGDITYIDGPCCCSFSCPDCPEINWRKRL